MAEMKRLGNGGEIAQVPKLDSVVHIDFVSV